MRIEIEIPKEFEEHFKQDKFEDSLHRLSADAHLIAGNYEQETAIMLIKAFKESKPAYDIEKVVAELEIAKEKVAKEDYCRTKHYVENDCEHKDCFKCCAEYLIDIVKAGGVE